MEDYVNMDRCYIFFFSKILLIVFVLFFSSVILRKERSCFDLWLVEKRRMTSHNIPLFAVTSKNPKIPNFFNFECLNKF